MAASPSRRTGLCTPLARPPRHDYAAELYKYKALHIARVYNYAFDLYWECSLGVPKTDDETLQALRWRAHSDLPCPGPLRGLKQHIEDD